MMKLVDVVKSSRKADTYLYLPQGTDWETLPDSLRSVFGDPQPVLTMKLTSERQLARYSGAEVLAALEDKGFFLQLPPAEPDQDDSSC